MKYVIYSICLAYSGYMAYRARRVLAFHPPAAHYAPRLGYMSSMASVCECVGIGGIGRNPLGALGDRVTIRHPTCHKNCVHVRWPREG